MIIFSEKAKQYFKKLLEKKKKDTNIRVFINFPGTKNAECGISYCLPEDIDIKNDVKYFYDFFYLYINKLFIPFLKDSKIDLLYNNLETNIVLEAPYAKKVYKINSSSSLLEKINVFLLNEINPHLSMHGGLVSLISITDSGYVVLKFHGGCNGCSMIDITVKNGIEKKLIKKFSQIKGVLDITNHSPGRHSYF